MQQVYTAAPETGPCLHPGDGTELTLLSHLWQEAQRSIRAPHKDNRAFSRENYTTTMNLNISARLRIAQVNFSLRRFALTAAPSYLLGGEHRGSSEAPLSPSAGPRSRRPSGSLLPPARQSRNVLRWGFSGFWGFFFLNNLPEQRQQLFPRSPARLSTSFQKLPTNTDMSLMLTHTTSAAVKIKQRKTGQ